MLIDAGGRRTSVPSSEIQGDDQSVCSSVSSSSARRVAEGDRPPARMGAVSVELRRVRHGASPTSTGRSALDSS